MSKPRILAELRTTAGLSQRTVSERMGVTQTQVSRIEAMYPDVMFPSLRSYLDAVGVDIRFVLDGVFDLVSGDVEQDMSRAEAVHNRKIDRSRRSAVTRSLAREELPLKNGQT